MINIITYLFTGLKKSQRRFEAKLKIGLVRVRRHLKFNKQIASTTDDLIL